MMQDEINTAPVNLLLAGLPAALQERLRSHLELTELQKNDVVFTSEGDNKYVYFPLTSSISLAHWRVDGCLVEISLVANEGVIGIPLLLIGTVVPCRAVVHTSGSAYRLPAALFQHELNRGGPFPCNFIHYADRLMLQLESTDHCDVHGIADRTSCAECNHAHACPERVRATAGTISDRAAVPANHDPDWQLASGYCATDVKRTQGGDGTWWWSVRSWLCKMRAMKFGGAGLFACPVTDESPVFDRESELLAITDAECGVVKHDSIAHAMQLIGSVFTYGREAIMIADTDFRVIETNDSFTRITGYARDEVVGKDIHSFHSFKQQMMFYADIWNSVTKDGYWTGDMWGQRKDGGQFPEMLTISAVRAENGAIQNYVAMFSDTSDTVAHRSQLEFMAHHDALTGLPNRSLFADRLQQAIAQSERRTQSLTVAYLDLDGFKTINDEHGHGVGDAMLVVLAQRMQAVVREGDTLARIGGDEFVALLIDVGDMHDWRRIVERLLLAANELVTVGTLQMHLSTSIGVAMFPKDGTDAGHLLLHADQAMYQAKQSGKNQYRVFDAVVAAETARQLWMPTAAEADVAARLQ